MTAADFRKAAIAIWGLRTWRDGVRQHFKVGDRRVRRWASGDELVPEFVKIGVERLGAERGK